MESQSRLLSICKNRLAELGLTLHGPRLDLEIQEIGQSKEAGYLLDLHDRRSRFAQNEHNSLVSYLLGLCPEPDLSRAPAYTTPEFPDIDIDYLPLVRDHLKNIWAPTQFGPKHVCHIANYSTYGIKSSLTDMARIFGGDRAEVLRLTKPLKPKDDEGDPLTWEKALEIYPELKAWTDKNPEIRDGAHRLMYADINWEKYDYKGEPPHRNRSTGMHAGGLIISNRVIADNVPLIRGKDGVAASAWPEGLHSQDLSQVGEVKHDLLVVDALEKIALCEKLVRERHGVKKVSAKPGGSAWSDLSYREDPACLKMANDGDLKGVFQFDSDGIRELAAFGGVTSFEDIVAYTALYRPGCIDTGMHMAYCRRKRREEPWELHPLLPFLGRSYNIPIYQEDIMRIVNVIGEIPMAEAQPLIKFISKKKAEKIEEYRERFMRGAERTIGDREFAEYLFTSVEAFGGYGFNRSHAVGYTVMSSRMLYFKCHYPIEFYTALMSCLDTADERLREYKLDAADHDVVVEKPDLNLSGANFKIVDGKILWGLGKIKGVGKASSERIVVGQPYHGVEDFFARFGTDGVVVKPIVGLKMFKDAAPMDLYRYYLRYKDKESKKRAKAKKWPIRRGKLLSELAALLGDVGDGLSIDDLRRIADDRGAGKKFISWQKKWLKAEKLYTTVDQPLKLVECAADVGKSVDKNLSLAMEVPSEGEEMFLGFAWEHPLRRSESFTGATFASHRRKIREGHNAWLVEVMVRSVKVVVARSGKRYMQIAVDDANFDAQTVNVWEEDIRKFEDVMQPGRLLRLQLLPPSKGFRTYSLESVPKWQRPKYEDPNKLDYRVVAMRDPAKEAT